MPGLHRIDRRNYNSLIIAGLGAVGRSLITLGTEQFSHFEHICALDKDSSTLPPPGTPNITYQAGDISEPQFINAVMRDIPGPALFVNLCSGTNNVRIRHNLARYATAYLDSCASSTDDPGEYRFSRMMPYSYTEITSKYPHWLCWGINPGLVEIITRRIIADLPACPEDYDVTVFEFDRLENCADTDRAAVGWCPESLVEEVMLSPTLEIVDGMVREDGGSGSRHCMVNWDKHIIPSRIVGHEDIWNMTAIPGVKNSRFCYSLSPAVMDILKMADAGIARSKLYIPGQGDALTGLEQVAVKVKAKHLEKPQTMVWTENHQATWKQYGVNAVQYQTAKSLLLAIMLMQHTDYGLVPHACNASNLPVASRDWPVIAGFMQELGINWQDGAHLNLHVTKATG